MINKVVNCGNWKEIQMGSRAPILSHLFFADDCLLFLQDDGASDNNLNQILQDYESVFG